MPSWSQIEAQARAVFMALAGIAVTMGWLSEGSVATIVGVVMLIAGSVWSILVNRPAALVQAASSVDAVKLIEVKPGPSGQAINAATGAKVKLG